MVIKISYIGLTKKHRMKNIVSIILLILSLQTNAQTAQIEIPETYELSNIILALTDYGIADDWEVQKETEYYQSVLTYFEPVKNHPLLDSVNYSRKKWEDYLSFRTDAVAFSFDKDGKLKRDFNFFANKGFSPFDDNLNLINDFVVKSNFRQFYQEQQGLYNQIISNYEDYNFVKEMLLFLDNRIGKQTEEKDVIYKIILSPLVFRMNCHRDLSKNIVADFPSMGKELINGIDTSDNIEDRLNGNHLIFTEKDHEYINPITNRLRTLVISNFKNQYWDNNSGYPEENSFNEYMTWAVYDLFLDEYFPEYAKKLSTFWQYQNASRGFFAQNLFSEKLKELYRKNEGKKFQNIYKPLLKWTKEIETTITFPELINVDTRQFIKTDTNKIQLEFSEEMNTKDSFGLIIEEFKDGKKTGKNQNIEINDSKWTDEEKKVIFKIDTEYEEFSLVFNWWEIEKPLISKKGIFLKPLSYILLKK